MHTPHTPLHTHLHTPHTHLYTPTHTSTRVLACLVVFDGMPHHGATPPQENMELISRQSKPITVTSLSFPTNEVNKFVVGSEEKTVYQCQRHSSSGQGGGIYFDGHLGPITSVRCHKAASGQVGEGRWGKVWAASGQVGEGRWGKVWAASGQVGEGRWGKVCMEK